MFSVYVNKFNPIPGSYLSNGDTETLLFSIPNQNGDIRPFLTASVNNEMGSAGSFEFSVDPMNFYYSIWKHMRTLVRVEYDGDTIFYGRVLTVDQDMFQTLKIHCEGAYTFFMDSLFEGKKEGYTIPLDEYIDKLIDGHNDCMRDMPEKKIYAGEVPGHYTIPNDDVRRIPVDTQKFGKQQGYKTVKEYLDTLVSDYGGQMRVRYNATDGKLYLDWMKVYFNADLSNQTMTINENALDLSHTIEVNNIFTHVLPVGKNNKYIDGGSGGGGGGGEGKYKVTCTVYPKLDVLPGRVWATPSRSNGGDVIRINYTNFAGFTLLKLEASSAGGAVKIFAGNSFMMPEADVTVKATFKELEDDSGGEGGLLPE